ncbi:MULTISPECIES: DUF3995 domain-containing protein [Rhodomicrobium]|uniref:DUF3995 domain-containing protein n=1 Tax=Rhodomicrobium TaxID=1068 RepID=UPI000B4B3EA9|nr:MULTISPECIES: DUF3995 domain-containing protein [Rhodomicrobium]
MSFVAATLTVILAAIAALHAYWALGGLWPGRDQTELARTVVGNVGVTHMPPASLTAIVAALIAAVAAWPLLIAPLLRLVLPHVVIAAATILIGAVFMLRGLLGYSEAMRRRHAAEPFATYNRLYYSPLCLALGGGFLILASSGGMA